MKGSTALIIAGVVALIGGIVALAFPLPASLAVAIFVGWAFVVSGALGLWAAFSDGSLPNRGWFGLLSLLNLVLGVWMLARPLEGMISLTIVVGALFLVSGASRLYLAATEYRGSQMMWTMVLSALISLGLGLYILFRLPEASAVALGVLLAVELIVVGTALLMAGMAMRRIGRP